MVWVRCVPFLLLFESSALLDLLPQVSPNVLREYTSPNWTSGVLGNFGHSPRWLQPQNG
jgi:hypothetical protein